MSAIIKYGKSVSLDGPAPAGYYAVGPAGQVVVSRMGAPLKKGWRLAKHADVVGAVIRSEPVTIEPEAALLEVDGSDD